MDPLYEKMCKDETFLREHPEIKARIELEKSTGWKAGRCIAHLVLLTVLGALAMAGLSCFGCELSIKTWIGSCLVLWAIQRAVWLLKS